jgi:hypothetical protein
MHLPRQLLLILLSEGLVLSSLIANVRKSVTHPVLTHLPKNYAAVLKPAIADPSGKVC